MLLTPPTVEVVNRILRVNLKFSLNEVVRNLFKFGRLMFLIVDEGC